MSFIFNFLLFLKSVWSYIFLILSLILFKVLAEQLIVATIVLMLMYEHCSCSASLFSPPVLWVSQQLHGAPSSGQRRSSTRIHQPRGPTGAGAWPRHPPALLPTGAAHVTELPETRLRPRELERPPPDQRRTNRTTTWIWFCTAEVQRFTGGGLTRLYCCRPVLDIPKWIMMILTNFK